MSAIGRRPARRSASSWRVLPGHRLSPDARRAPAQRARPERRPPPPPASAHPHVRAGRHGGAPDDLGGGGLSVVRTPQGIAPALVAAGPAPPASLPRRRAPPPRDQPPPDGSP